MDENSEFQRGFKDSMKFQINKSLPLHVRLIRSGEVITKLEKGVARLHLRRGARISWPRLAQGRRWPERPVDLAP